MTQKIWDRVHKQWKKRNEDRHGTDPTSKEKALYDHAVRKTLAMYELHHQVDPKHMDAFFTTPESHMAAFPTSSALRQWLNMWKPLIVESVRNAKKTGSHLLQHIGTALTQQNHHG